MLVSWGLAKILKNKTKSMNYKRKNQLKIGLYQNLKTFSIKKSLL